MGRIATGWNLTKASFRVLKLDPEILAIPAMAAITMVLFVGIELAVGWTFLGGALQTADGGVNIGGLVLLYLVYVTASFVGIFFNAAIVEEATVRFNGQNPTIRDGLSKAWSKKGAILKWAFVAATVGIILRALRERAGSLAGQLAVGLAEFGWAVATFFVVPILIYKDVGPIEAVKRSGNMVKAQWGEALTGVIATRLIFFLLGLIGLAVLFAGFAIGTPAALIAGIGIAVVYWLLLAAAHTGVRGILVAALYHYDETGEMPNGFEAATPSAGHV